MAGRLLIPSSIGRLPRLVHAASTKAPKVKLRPVLATMADYQEMLHWALNIMTYVEPLERVPYFCVKVMRQKTRKHLHQKSQCMFRRLK